MAKSARLEPVGDLDMLCQQCGEDWTLTEEERRKAFREGRSALAKRCPSCRRDSKEDVQ